MWMVVVADSSSGSTETDTGPHRVGISRKENPLENHARGTARQSLISALSRFSWTSIQRVIKGTVNWAGTQ